MELEDPIHLTSREHDNFAWN